MRQLKAIWEISVQDLLKLEDPIDQDKEHFYVMPHNHPSGDVSPSANDIRVTRQLWRAGETLLIPLLDHLIVTPTTYYSFRKGNNAIWITDIQMRHTV